MALTLAAVCFARGPAALAQDLVVGAGAVEGVGAPATYTSVVVVDGGVLLVNAPLTVTGDMTVGRGGLVTMDAGVTTLSLDVGGTLAVEVGGAIDVGALGLPAGVTIDPVTRARKPTATSGAASHCARGEDAPLEAVYDDLFDPRLPGSGGSAADLSGGGALVVRAGRMRLDGVLRADAVRSVYSEYRGGAGGAINLDVGDLSGGGDLWARGSGVGRGAPEGAGGCVRVLASSSSFTGTLDVSADSAAPGSALFIARGTTAVTLTAGTLELRGGHRLGPLSVAPGARLRALGSATVEGALSVPAGASLHLESPVALDRMALPPRIDGHLAVLTDLASPADLVLGGTMSLDARFTVGSLEVLPGASVTHSPGVRTMHLIATRTLRVAAGGRIDVSGKGLASETTIDPLSGATVPGSKQFNGGSHGGAGGLADDAGTRALPYDTPEDPRLPGGGGGYTNTGQQWSWVPGGAGGGVLRLSAGTAVIDGSLNSDGTLPPPGAHPGGSGAGGSVILRVGALSGTGAITARGPQVREATGGGGGGLILVVSDTSAFSGVISAAGGLGRVDGAPGVVTLRTEASAPSIVSTPPHRARIGQSYGYVPTATGTRPLSWSLVAAPTGASIDNDTGALSWTPPSQGAFPFELVVTNAFGAATQRFELAVSDEADDGAPRFLSTPSTAAHCGVPYRSGAVRTPRVSGEGPWTFELRAALDAPLPPSLRMEPSTGELLWTPTSAEAGTHAVELRATGPSGVARQVFAVVVECDARLAVGCGCAGPQLRSAPPPWWLVLGLVGLLVRLHAPRGGRKPLNSRRNAPPCA